MARKNWFKNLLCLLALGALATGALADGAEVAVAYKGSDVWRSVSGSTFSSFADDPIPADFFCPGSRAFEGTVKMKGKPFVTEPAGFLGQADTIVERLDDATFDARGLAITRLQMRALSLVSEEPLEAGCERPFDVAVSLAGEQPITEMRIQKTDAGSGTYHAPLALRVRLAFTPVGGGETLEIVRRVDLGPGDKSYWTTTDRVGRDHEGNPVLVDTDSDGVADSPILGQSNFRTGLALVKISPDEQKSCPPGLCLEEICHCNPCSEDPDEPPCEDTTHQHCLDLCVEPEPFEPCATIVF